MGHSITPTDKGHNIPPTVPWQNFTFDKMSEPDLFHGSALPPALFFASSIHTFILALNVPFSTSFECSAFPFFPPLLNKCQCTAEDLYFFFPVFLPHTKLFIWVTIWVPGRKWRGGGLIQHLIIQLLLERKKMLSVFKQLVHVAIASASLLHFPVSERQMNRNDCFVLLRRRLSELHKTYF